MRLGIVFKLYEMLWKYEILPGQKSISAPDVLRVPGQISRGPCEVGAYAYRGVINDS